MKNTILITAASVAVATAAVASARAAGLFGARRGKEGAVVTLERQVVRRRWTPAQRIARLTGTIARLEKREGELRARGDSRAAGVLGGRIRNLQTRLRELRGARQFWAA